MSSILSMVELGGHGTPHAPRVKVCHQSPHSVSRISNGLGGWLRASTAPGRALPGVRYYAAIILVTLSSRAQLLLVPSSSTTYNGPLNGYGHARTRPRRPRHARYASQMLHEHVRFLPSPTPSYLWFKLTSNPRLFTWSTQDLCLVFRWWHISGTFSLLASLLAVVALGVGYEYTRALARRQSLTIEGMHSPGLPRQGLMLGADVDDEGESSSLLPGRTVARRRGGRVVKALLYGGQVFYSFFIM